MIQEMNGHRQRLRSIESELGDLNQEVVKSLRGESEIGITILQGAIEHTNARLKAEKQRMAELEKSLTATQWKKERFLSTCTQSEALLKALRGKSDQAAMDVLHSLIKRIDVRGTNDVSITYFFSSADKSEARGDLPVLAASNP